MLGFVPTWNAWNYASWGLGGLANSWLYSGWANPYVIPSTQTIVVQQPVVVEAGAPASTGQVIAYDYSKPIDVTAPAPDPAVTDAGQQVFSSARSSFTSGDFARALAVTDQALVQLPNDAVLHEFRALCLFALSRFDEAATVVYTVLSAGPGWDWATLVGLYPSVDAYTAQLRALENFVTQHQDDAAAQFLLAYHYMVQGNKDAAAVRFRAVAQLQPKDQLSAGFAQMLAKGQTLQSQSQAQAAQTSVAQAAPTAAQTAQTTPANGAPPAPSEPPPAVAASGTTGDSEQPPPPPPPPPADLAGTWKAEPGPGQAITLTLAADGAFTWSLAEKGKTQSIQGKAGFQDGILALNQEDGPPLIGKLNREGAKKFSFKPAGAPESVKGLEFTR
jgi:tetratricopeptide (TPR) repeat protein